MIFVKLRKTVGTLLTLVLVINFSILHTANARTTDLWQVMRQNFTLDDELTDHQRVQDKIDWYLNYPGYIHLLLTRAKPYLYFILNETQKRHLPAELALIPFVESEFAPAAQSSAGAQGFWQLMPGTATGMNVKISRYFDGRQDIVDSTHAALNYLTYLYNFFDHDWLLAMAAYDAGAGRVQKGIKSYHSFFELKPTIWDLSLPHETQHYLPKILALKAIIQHPERFDLTLPKLPYKPYFCMIKRHKNQPNLAELTQLTGLATKELLNLNTGIKKHNLDYQPQKWLIPVDVCRHVFRKLNHFYHHPQHYTIQKGDTLSTIAHRYHIPLKQLLRINHMTKKSVIRPGQKLYLASHSGAKDHRQYQFHYRCKANENIAEIARKFHLTVKQILFWNHLRPHDKLHQHQRLTLWLRKAHKKHSTKTKPKNRRHKTKKKA